VEETYLTHAHALASSVDKRDARHPSGHVCNGIFRVVGKRPHQAVKNLHLSLAIPSSVLEYGHIVHLVGMQACFLQV
jgi:hypothetical protein